MVLVFDCSFDYLVLSFEYCVGSFEIWVLMFDIGLLVGCFEGIGFVVGKVINIK